MKALWGPSHQGRALEREEIVPVSQGDSQLVHLVCCVLDNMASCLFAARNCVWDEFILVLIQT